LTILYYIDILDTSWPVRLDYIYKTIGYKLWKNNQ